MNNDYKGQEFIMEKGKETWSGQELATKSDPIIDPGTGKALVLRVFEFGMNPDYKGRRPCKQDIFNMHWRQLSTILWSDGLVPKEDLNPRLEFIKGNKYQIFLLCKPRSGTMIAEKPKTLQDLFKKRR